MITIMARHRNLVVFFMKMLPSFVNSELLYIVSLKNGECAPHFNGVNTTRPFGTANPFGET
jgi:hypothetical protein